MSVFRPPPCHKSKFGPIASFNQPWPRLSWQVHPRRVKLTSLAAFDGSPWYLPQYSTRLLPDAEAKRAPYPPSLFHSHLLFAGVPRAFSPVEPRARSLRVGIAFALLSKCLVCAYGDVPSVHTARQYSPYEHAVAQDRMLFLAKGQHLKLRRPKIIL